MATWNSRGLRGSTLEELINRTNEKYRENGLALIQKIPTPITPMKIDKESRHITLAYFDQKSTVDYIGSVQEFPSVSMPRNVQWTRFLSKTSMRIRSLLCAILKSRRALLFPLYYTHRDTLYYLTFRRLLEFWNRAQEGGRKSFRLEELDMTYQLPKKAVFSYPIWKCCRRICWKETKKFDKTYFSMYTSDSFTW